MYFLKYFGYDIDFHKHHFFSVQKDLESFLFRNVTIDGDTKIGLFTCKLSTSLLFTIWSWFSITSTTEKDIYP